MCELCNREQVKSFDDIIDAASERFDGHLENMRDLHRLLPDMVKRDAKFALDLIDQFGRDFGLSPKQWYWVEMLAQRYQQSEPIYGSFNAILVMFRLAQSHGLKRPRVRLLSDGVAGEPPTYFELWFRPGEESERTIEIMIGGWQGHGRRRFGGHIVGDRIIPFRDRLTPDIRATIQELALDPIGTAKAMAQRLGVCMYCGSRLSDDESKSRGYGPVCAEHYGLPWGSISAHDRTEVQRIMSTPLEELFS